MGRYDERGIKQIFVRELQFSTEPTGLRASGKVEINLTGVGKNPQGPQVDVGFSIDIDPGDNAAAINSKFVAAAKDVIDRIARESTDLLIQEEAKPYDDKWPKFGSEPDSSED